MANNFVVLPKHAVALRDSCKASHRPRRQMINDDGKVCRRSFVYQIGHYAEGIRDEIIVVIVRSVQTNL